MNVSFIPLDREFRKKYIGKNTLNINSSNKLGTNNEYSKCEVCEQIGNACKSHPLIIETPIRPNLLLLPRLEKILKLFCGECYKLKISDTDINMCSNFSELIIICQKNCKFCCSNKKPSTCNAINQNIKFEQLKKFDIIDIKKYYTNDLFVIPVKFRGELKTSVNNFEKGYSLIITNKDIEKGLLIIREELIKIIKGKQGFIRKNIDGKRSDFSGRAVITPDIFLDPYEIGVPEIIANELLVPIKITEENICNVYEDCKLGKYKYYTKKNITFELPLTNCFTIHQMRDYCFIIGDVLLEVGDSVNRPLTDGDYVVINRQPTLTVDSFICLKTKVCNGFTLRLNPCYIGSLHGDFDGDEVNIYVARSKKALESIINGNTIKSLFNRKRISLIEDSIVGMKLLNIYKNKINTTLNTDYENIGNLQLLGCHSCDIYGLSTSLENTNNIELMAEANSKFGNDLYERIVSKYMKGLDEEEYLEIATKCRTSLVRKNLMVAPHGHLARILALSVGDSIS
jgi:hypothetical protein